MSPLAIAFNVSIVAGSGRRFNGVINKFIGGLSALAKVCLRLLKILGRACETNIAHADLHAAHRRLGIQGFCTR